jgi:acyl-CoA synthetase (AMP-forming)/AMP-acid ligase II
MNIRNVMRRGAEQFPDQTAVVLGDQRLTYAEAWTRGVKLANGLASLGMKPGDAFSTLEKNTIGSVDSLLAGSAGGFVRGPLYDRNGRDSHIKMCDNAKAKVLIAESFAAELVAGLEAEVPTLEHILLRDETYETWLDAQSDVDPDAPVDDDDPYMIRHTGGTTGDPKGLMLTNRMWMSISRDYHYIFPPIEFGEATLHIGPLSHASGTMVIPGWAMGAKQVLLDNFDPASCLEIMERESVSHGFVPPTAMAMMVRVPGAEDRDWSKLKALMLGAAPITPATLLRAREVFGDVLFQIYGQSEGSPIASMGPQEWFAEIEGSEPLRAAGRPHPYVEVEIWDQEGTEPRPRGEVGEVVFKCDSQIDGFLNAPEESNRRFVDGWVRSGDIGRIDENGYLYLLDRANDMIISGGFNIYPRELEDVIASHPAVIEVAVFGVPHEKWGETPYVACYVEDPDAVGADEIIALVADRLGSYKKPSGVELTDQPLPKTPVGKIARRVLRDRHWGAEARVGGA